MRGPKPTPRNLRIVRGDPPGKLNPDEPQVEVAIPDPPEHLEGRERDVFTEMAGKLARMRIMSNVDADALAIYAVNYVRWQEATATVRETGLLMRSPQGFPLQNPALAVANKAQDVCLKILAEFGMTPSSRTRVKSG